MALDKVAFFLVELDQVVLDQVALSLVVLAKVAFFLVVLEQVALDQVFLVLVRHLYY